METKLKHTSIRIALLLVFSIFNVANLISQDIHFSQYGASYMNLNPAFTGFFDGDYRLHGIYRSQWTSVPVPYKTISFAADGRFKTKNMKSDCFGGGVLFNNDKSGDTQYGTNQIYLSGSYIKKVNKDSTLLWGSGLTLGVSSIGFNYSKMTFDDQYQNGSFNSNASTGENFSRNASTYLDVNLGTFIQYTFKQRAYIQYGISYLHLNSPRLSFQNNANIKIDSKLTNFIHFNYPLASQLDVAAEVMIATQGKYKEIIPGALIKYNIEPNTNQTIAAGFYYRLKDAAIARIGYNYKTTTVGFSYDINTSKFIAATNRRGAFEIYITHVFKKIIPFVPKTKVCPVFM
jgi:type IX secretion system PorP/SprF family membrane protein